MQNKMAMIRDPLNRGRFIRVNDGYDNQDVVVENVLSEKKQFRDLPRVNQLTQNSWNFSPYTRENNYNDVVVKNPPVVGRLEKYSGLLDPRKYHEHR